MNVRYGKQSYWAFSIQLTDGHVIGFYKVMFKVSFYKWYFEIVFGREDI